MVQLTPTMESLKTMTRLVGKPYKYRITLYS